MLDDERMTDRKHERNTPSDCFGPIQVSLRAEKQIFLSTGRLPRNYGGAIEKNLDSFARWQTRRDTRIVVGDGNLRGWCDGRDRNGGRFLRTLHLDLGSCAIG